MAQVEPSLLPIPAEDESSVLALNNAFATELSWLDRPRLRALLHQAFYARQVGKTAAFLIAFDQTADYDSPNFLWFRERFARFVYVDRIAVAVHSRKQGHARRLYADLIDYSQKAAHDLLVCEVNAEPPNPASDRFHAALGFAVVGAAEVHGGSKTVRYLARALRQPEEGGADPRAAEPDGEPGANRIGPLLGRGT